jgi:hypothetical protein
MRFEHLVQINDPLDERIESLTRGQLWKGLVVRAERPAHFLIGLDECRIVERGVGMLVRELRFGTLQVRDRVALEPEVQVRFDVEPTAEVSGASLVIRIEEPQPGQLFLRFAYELQGAGDDAEIDEYRKSAYCESDIDTVRMIRQLAASGVLSDEGPTDAGFQ